MLMRNSRLWGKCPLVGRCRSTHCESLVFMLLVGIALSLCSWQAPVWAGPSPGADEFIQKLQLSRSPEATLQEILSRAEFKDSDRESLMDRLRAWISEIRQRMLAWIWERIPSASFPEAELGTVWTVLGSFVVAALLVVVGILAWYSIRFFGSKQTSAQEEAGPDLSEIATSNELRLLATRSSETGNFREALIYMFRSVLLWLDERGKLSLHKVKTNREVLESLRNDKRLREAFGDMVPVFNRVRYGNYPCDKHDYEKFLATCNRVDGG